VLFGPARALRITYDAIQQSPEHALGIVLGMLAATEAYDAQLAQGLEQSEDTQALEAPKQTETVGARPLREPVAAKAK
jgi:hypothetical protein